MRVEIDEVIKVCVDHKLVPAGDPNLSGTAINHLPLPAKMYTLLPLPPTTDGRS